MARIRPQAPSLSRCSLPACWTASSILVLTETIAVVIEDAMSLRGLGRGGWGESVSGAEYV